MTAVVSSPFSIQIVGSNSPYTNWTVGQYQKIFTGSTSSYGNIVGEPHAGIAAYSGGVVDTARGRLLLFGGGHGDYGGNEVWALNLLRPQDKWTQLTASTTFSVAEEDAAFAYADNQYHPGGYINGTPISRHTYNTMTYVSSMDEMWAGGSSTWSGGYGAPASVNDGLGDALWNCWPNEPCDVWSLSASALTWTYRGSALLNSGADQLPVVPGPMVYSATRDRVYTLTNKIKSGSYYYTNFGPPNWGANAYQLSTVAFKVWECVPQTNVWTVHSGNAPNLYFLIAIDEANDRLVALSAGTTREIWIYPLGSRIWSKVTTVSGTAPPPSTLEGDVMHYSTLTGRMLYISRQERGVRALTIDSAGTAATWSEVVPNNTLTDYTLGYPACYDRAHSIFVIPVLRASAMAIDVYAVKA